jgi:hypothetical protein
LAFTEARFETVLASDLMDGQALPTKVRNFFGAPLSFGNDAARDIDAAPMPPGNQTLGGIPADKLNQLDAALTFQTERNTQVTSATRK